MSLYVFVRLSAQLKTSSGILFLVLPTKCINNEFLSHKQFVQYLKAIDLVVPTAQEEYFERCAYCTYLHTCSCCETYIFSMLLTPSISVMFLLFVKVISKRHRGCFPGLLLQPPHAQAVVLRAGAPACLDAGPGQLYDHKRCCRGEQERTRR